MSREPVFIHPRKSFSAKDRARIFALHDGICGISKRKIQAGEAWEIEHRIPLALGGTNEDDNLYSALVEPHKGKTRTDKGAIAKCKRIEARLNGTRRERKPIPSRGFPVGGPKQKIQSRGFQRKPKGET
jgi:5-methylcytosine-specific restriction endonuclease McrA